MIRMIETVVGESNRYEKERKVGKYEMELFLDDFSKVCG